MRIILLLISLCLITTINAQDSSDIMVTLPDFSGHARPWSHTDFNNDPGHFKFAILPDRTGGHRPGVLEDAVKKLNLLQPEFIISVGDMIEGYTVNDAEIYQQWTVYNSFIKNLGIPFFYIPGNHDYTNASMARIWEELFGPSFYHFIYKNVLFLCLNTEESMLGSATEGIGLQQFDFVKGTLEDNPDVRWTFVLMHRPLWLESENGYWDEVENLLKQRDHTVIAGHSHHYVKYERNNGKYFVLSTAGGTSELRGPDFGEFDQVAMVSMSDEGPVLANLVLQGIWDENVVTEELYNMVNSKNILVEPVFLDEEKFVSTEFRIVASNEYEYPAWLYLTFGENPTLKPEIMSYQKEIMPNTIEIITLPVNTIVPVEIKRIEPLVLKAWMIYKYEEDRQINVNSKFAIAPVKKEYSHFTNGKIWIDGIIEEWEGLSYRAGIRSPKTGDMDEYNGDYDASFEFDTRYDHENLYAAISVWDDELVVVKDQSHWIQDVMRVYLDARPVEISSNGRGETQSDDILFISFSPVETKKADVNVYQEERLPQNILIVAKKTLAGFDAEISIPLSYLDFKNGADWESFRLNLAFIDVDQNNSRTIIWWRPAWDSDDNYIGSGMFFKRPE